jgi:hypothetical protein
VADSRKDEKDQKQKEGKRNPGKQPRNKVELLQVWV